MGIEQREFPRLEQEFPVRFEVVQPNLPRPLAKPRHKGIAKNISGGGLYIVIVSRLPKSTVKKLLEHRVRLSIEFYLPDFQSRVKALGEVQWSKEKVHWWQIWPKRWSLGIKFTYIQPEDRDCIIKYVINKKIEDQLVDPVRK